MFFYIKKASNAKRNQMLNEIKNLPIQSYNNVLKINSKEKKTIVTRTEKLNDLPIPYQIRTLQRKAYTEREKTRIAI